MSVLDRLADMMESGISPEVHVPWREVARPEQLIPEGEWRAWYIQGGRGSGKTRAAAESFAELIGKNPGGGWGVVAPSFGEARDVCMEGPSGLLKALGDEVQTWNRSLGELKLTNGGTVWIDGADDGATSIQGKNLKGCWCDEIGVWRAGRRDRSRSRPWWEVAWDESIAFAVRISPAKIIASGTPKAGHGLVKRLIADTTVPKSRLRLDDNVENLHPAAVAELKRQYAGTRLGQQELEGELIEEIEGALWTWEMIEPYRIDNPADIADVMGQMRRIVVAVDPSWGTKGDECGIGVAGVGHDHRGYVIADLSARMPPAEWGAVAADAYRTYRADRLLSEVNFQGEQVKLVMKTTDPKIPVKEIRVTRGKALRAEPVVALYEQGKCSHLGRFPGLESQMTEWVDGVSSFSPDRVDWLTMAFTELMLTDAGPSTLHNPRDYW